MMEKAVYQHEIKPVCRRSLIPPHVGHDKIAAVALSCCLNVAFVDVNSKIVCASEEFSIGTGPASDVKNPAHISRGVVCQHRHKFLSCKWGLPRPVHPGSFQSARSQIHARRSYCDAAHRLHTRGSWMFEALDAMNVLLRD